MFSIRVPWSVKLVFRRTRTSISVIALLTLAIGINAAIFSLVDAVFFRPLPYPDWEELVFIWEGSQDAGFPNDTPAPGNYSEWTRRAQSFSSIAAISPGTFNLTGDQDPIRIEGKRVTSNLFQLMGVPPLLGRGLSEEADRAGGSNEVVISYGLWRRWFGASQGAIGTSLTIDDQPHTVVGIMPPHFRFPTSDTDVWLPAALSTETLADRRSHYLTVVGRLGPGISMETAQSEMTEIMAQLAEEYPETNASVGAGLVALREQLAGSVQRPFVLLLGAAGCILLIACANIASLLLVHATGRQQEMAVRGALGASRSQLARQLIEENIVLALAGGLLGGLLAASSLSFLERFLPPEILGSSSLALTPVSLVFVGLLTMATAGLFGLTPALYAARTEVGRVLQKGGRGGIARSSSLRQGLIVGEVALAFALLVGSGLFVQTFLRAQQVDPGFDAESVLTMRVDLPFSRYGRAGARDRFYDEVLERVRALPSVQHAGVVTFLPLTRSGGSRGFEVEGRTEDSGRDRIANYRVVSEGYFEAMGTRLLEGRPISQSDNSTAVNAVWINEEMVRRFFDSEIPLGRRIRLGSRAPWREIAGVVENVRQTGIESDSRPEMYLPYRQVAEFNYFNPRDLAVRTLGDPSRLVSAVREQLRAVDPELPVADVQTLSAILDREFTQRRLQVSILAGFAAVALFLATLGIYGLLAHSVLQRTREIGVRMALGAHPGQILRRYGKTGLVLSSVGVAIGLVVTYLASSLVSDYLFEVSPMDPKTVAACAVILMSASFTACWIPAARATRVDPSEALRS